MTRIFPKMISVLKREGYRVFERPGELNIVGIRSRRTKPGKFDDELHVFYRKKIRTTGAGIWAYHIYKVTTDPGTYWLQSDRANTFGTAILAQGQYENAYVIGNHKGLYPALVQAGPVDVIRDFDRDVRLDFKSPRTQTGVFGINIHRAASSGKSVKVEQWSAGCTVFADPLAFAEFMALCAAHRAMYGNVFTYTLIDFRDRLREQVKRGVLGAAAGSALFALYSLWKNGALEQDGPAAKPTRRKRQTA